MKATSERRPASAKLDQAEREAFRALAARTDGIDVEVYRKFDKDPLEPIVGLGRVDAPIAFFGRDPGREEVRHGEPFIGAGGQLVRRVLYRPDRGWGMQQKPQPGNGHAEIEPDTIAALRARVAELERRVDQGAR